MYTGDGHEDPRDHGDGDVYTGDDHEDPRDHGDGGVGDEFFVEGGDAESAVDASRTMRWKVAPWLLDEKERRKQQKARNLRLCDGRRAFPWWRVSEHALQEPPA
jgi:hypothetical protein